MAGEANKPSWSMTQEEGRTWWLRLPALGHRRLLQARVRRSPPRREGHHCDRVSPPGACVVRPRSHPHRADLTDNGSCFRADAFARSLLGSRHQRITPYTPRHNGKVERCNRILVDEFLRARPWLQNNSALRRSRSGTSTTTITAHTAPWETGHQLLHYVAVSPTSWPRTTDPTPSAAS